MTMAEPRGPHRVLRCLAAAGLVLVALGVPAGITLGAQARPALGAQAGTAPAEKAVAAKAVPVYAYFYQWFTRPSWNRAKQDFPLAGKYSSDDPRVLRTQIREARSAGIDGFITSWKDTETLNRRLDLLVHIARDEQLDLGVVYQALDFSRSPLPVSKVAADMTLLVNRWGSSIRSSYFGKPVIIWTGTDQYSVADVQKVRTALGERVLLLAAAKSVEGYQRVAHLVDGEAYYWSSADPQSPGTAAKLQAMAAAVHAHQGLWIAPAAPGFDGRTLGHSRVIDRHGGKTLQRSLDDAYSADPDAVGVISWNEWSENTYIEPGERYGTQDLNSLAQYLRERRGEQVSLRPVATAGTHSPGGSWSGLRAAMVLATLTAGAGVGLAWWAARRRV